MSKGKDKTTALTLAEMREAFAEDRDVRELRQRIREKEAELAAREQAAEAEEDAAIAAEVEADNAREAEFARRIVEEPPGSLEHAAREAKARGLDYIPSDLLDAMPQAERVRLYTKHRELWNATITQHGTEAIRSRI